MVQVATSINISFCLTSAIVTALSIAAYASLQSSFYYYDFILKNWKLNPITEIRLSYKTECEENEILLSHYLFPGTVEGCDCLQSNDFWKLGIQGSCNEDQLQSGCKYIPPVSARDFNYFTDPKNQTRFYLCGVKDKSYNFYDFGQYKECPQGYKQCGSEQQFVCTKNQKCPIFEIGYQNENQQTNNEYIEFEKGGLRLWYNRESSIEMPFVETRIGEGDICKDESLLPNSGENGIQDYPLMKQMKIDCVRDPRFKLFYKITEFEYYKINDSTDLIQKLPRFQIRNLTYWGLYHRGYITWNQQCKGDIFQNFLKLEPQQEQIQKFQSTLLIFQIVTFIGIGCFVNCISIVRKNQKFQVINVKLSFSCIFINFILAIILYCKSKGQVDSALEIANLNCSDSFTSNIITQLANEIGSNKHNFISATFAILVVASVIIITLIIILWKFNENKIIDIEYRKEQDQLEIYLVNFNQVEDIK